MDNREHKTVVNSPSLSKQPNKEVQQVSEEWNEESRSSGIPFGKHKGTPWKDIPEDYIGWIIEKSDNPNWRTMANAELVARMTEDASTKQQVAAEADSSTEEVKQATEKGWEVMEELKLVVDEDDDDLPF